MLHADLINQLNAFMNEMHKGIYTASYFLYFISSASSELVAIVCFSNLYRIEPLPIQTSVAISWFIKALRCVPEVNITEGC